MEEATAAWDGIRTGISSGDEACALAATGVASAPKLSECLGAIDAACGAAPEESLEALYELANAASGAAANCLLIAARRSNSEFMEAFVSADGVQHLLGLMGKALHVLAYLAGPHKGASIVLHLEFLAIERVRKSIHPTRP